MVTPSDTSGTQPPATEVFEGAYNPTPGEIEQATVIRAFHWIERGFLLLVALMTLGGAASELIGIWNNRVITLADILLMFLYTEVIGMIAVFYSAGRSAFIFPIFIAITALARLVVLQSKDMAPENIVYEAVAILLLTLAAVTLQRLLRT